MFLLNRAKTMTVLMTIFGILLSDLYIQPAQGRECYGCEPCEGHLGVKEQCDSDQNYCASGVRQLANGTEISFRACATNSVAQRKYYSCKKFKPFHNGMNPGETLRICFCKKNLCNGASSLLHPSIIGSVSTFVLGCLMMM